MWKLTASGLQVREPWPDDPRQIGPRFTLDDTGKRPWLHPYNGRAMIQRSAAIHEKRRQRHLSKKNP